MPDLTNLTTRTDWGVRGLVTGDVVYCGSEQQARGTAETWPGCYELVSRTVYEGPWGPAAQPRQAVAS